MKFVASSLQTQETRSILFLHCHQEIKKTSWDHIVRSNISAYMCSVGCTHCWVCLGNIYCSTPLDLINMCLHTAPAVVSTAYNQIFYTAVIRRERPFKCTINMLCYVFCIKFKLEPHHNESNSRMTCLFTSIMLSQQGRYMTLETGPGGTIVHLSTAGNVVFLSFNISVISVLHFVTSMEITAVSFSS